MQAHGSIGPGPGATPDGEDFLAPRSGAWGAGAPRQFSRQIAALSRLAKATQAA